MRRLILGVAAAALTITAAPGPAFAQVYGASSYPDDGYNSYDKKDPWARDPDEEDAPYGGPGEDGAYPDGVYGGDDYPDDDDRDARRDDEGRYERGGGSYEGETWQDEQGQLRCRRADGTAGVIIGGGTGALIGRAIDGHGERGTGMVIGAIFGALIGRAIERSQIRCE